MDGICKNTSNPFPGSQLVKDTGTKKNWQMTADEEKTVSDWCLFMYVLCRTQKSSSTSLWPTKLAALAFTEEEEEKKTEKLRLYAADLWAVGGSAIIKEAKQR